MSGLVQEHLSDMQPYLQDGETLEWVGKPTASFQHATDNPYVLRLFGLLLLIFAMALFIVLNTNPDDTVRARGVEGSGSTLQVTLGVIFVIPSGLGMLYFGFWLVRAYLADVAMLYAITNKRLLMVSTLPTALVSAYEKKDITEIRLVLRDGLQSLYFVQPQQALRKLGRGGFLRLADAKTPAEIIERVLAIRVDGLSGSKVPKPSTPLPGMLVKGNSGVVYDMRDEAPLLRAKGYSKSQIDQVAMGKMTMEDLLKTEPDNKPS